MDGPFKVNEFTATTFAKKLEFQLCQGGVGLREESSGNTLAGFADLELLRVEIRVREEGNLQWERVEQFNVAATEGILSFQAFVMHFQLMSFR